MNCPNCGEEVKTVIHRMESTFRYDVKNNEILMDRKSNNEPDGVNTVSVECSNCFESLDFKWVDLHDNPKLLDK